MAGKIDSDPAIRLVRLIDDVRYRVRISKDNRGRVTSESFSAMNPDLVQTLGEWLQSQIEKTKMLQTDIDKMRGFDWTGAPVG